MPKLLLVSLMTATVRTWNSKFKGNASDIPSLAEFPLYQTYEQCRFTWKIFTVSLSTPIKMVLYGNACGRQAIRSKWYGDYPVAAFRIMCQQCCRCPCPDADRYLQ